MKIFIIAAAVALLGFLVFTFAANSNNTTTPKLTMATVQTNIQSGAQLIDVRTPEEFQAGYIEGAVNAPLTGFQSGQLPDTTKDTKLYLYCRSGSRAGQAKSLLEQAGYTNITNLGGMDDVVAIGGNQIK